jgi:hypothetical protein
MRKTTSAYISKAVMAAWNRSNHFGTHIIETDYSKNWKASSNLVPSHTLKIFFCYSAYLFGIRVNLLIQKGLCSQTDHIVDSELCTYILFSFYYFKYTSSIYNMKINPSWILKTSWSLYIWCIQWTFLRHTEIKLNFIWSKDYTVLISTKMKLARRLFL